MAKKSSSPARKPAPAKKPEKKAVKAPPKAKAAPKKTAPANVKPAAKERADWPRLWREDIADPQALFHEAALFLKKHTGYETLNLLTGSGKKAVLLCVHNAGASYLADEPAEKLELIEANTPAKSAQVYVLENDAPARKSWEGPVVLVRVPGSEDYILLASGAGAPSYSRSDVIDLQAFAPVLSRVFFKFQADALSRKAAETSAKLKDAEKAAKEAAEARARDRAEHERALAEAAAAEKARADEKRKEEAAKFREKIESLETALKEADARAEQKRAEEARGYEDRLHSLERELHTTAERAADTAKKLTETERFLQERTGLLEREVASLTAERDNLRRSTDEKETALEAMRDQAEQKEKELTTLLDESIAAERTEMARKLKETEDNLRAQIESQKARLTQEIEDLKKSSGDRIAALELELESAGTDHKQKLDAAIAAERQAHAAAAQEFEKQLAEARQGAGELGKTIQSVREELARSQDESRRLKESLDRTEKDKQNTAKERDEARSVLARLETELTQEKSQAGDLAGSLRKQISDLNARIDAEAKRFQGELAEREARIRETSSQLEEERRKLEQSEKKSRDESVRHQSEIQRFEKEVADARIASDRRSKEHNEKVLSLEGRIQTLNAEVEARNRSIRELKDQIAALEKARDGALAHGQNLQKEIEARDGRISKLNQELDQARKEIERLKQEKAEQQKQIKSFEELLLARDRQLKSQGEEIALRDEEIGRLTKETAGLRETKTANEASIAALQKEIAQYREREHRLEQDILQLQDEKRQLSARIESLNEEIKKHKDRIDSEIRQREAVQTELSSVRAREKKLGEELKSAQAREKGSREEGIILFNFARALTEEESFRGKLDALIRGLSTRMEIARLGVYSVQGDDLLALEEMHQGSYAPLKERLYVPVSKTSMGSAMASLKAVLLPQGELEAPGEVLTKAGVNGKKGYGLVLPLMESKNTIGVLVLYSPASIPETEQRLLENLAPLIATSLRQRLEESARSYVSRRTSTKDAVIRYFEARMQRFGVEIDPLRKPEEQLASFEVFAHNLVTRLKSAGIETELGVSPPALLTLAGRIQSPANLHYIALEAVENIEKHSQASTASISLKEIAGGAIEFAIEDDGEGLLRTAGSETPAHGEGVRAIRNLAEDAGAECRMAKGPGGRGLRIECVWRSGPG